MRIRIVFLALLLLFAVTACNLSTSRNTQNNNNNTVPTPPLSNRPTVTINSPANGAEFVVDQQVLVSVTASDSVGVSRVQLLANGQIVKTISSESATGDRTMSALLDYMPRTEGPVTLQVIAYRLATASEPAQVQINVRRSQTQVVATQPPAPVNNVPVINPNDPTCRVLVNVGLNLRGGPSTSYPVLRVLSAGLQAPIVGRLADNSWWQVRVDAQIGWVSGDFVTVYGICTAVPVISAPPTATPTAPTATPTVPPTNTLTLTPPVPTATPTSGPPDLIVSNITGPTTLSLGPGNSPVSASFTVTITNSGAGPTGQFANLISVSPGDTRTPLGTVPNLNPGESIVLTVSLTFSATGTYTLQATADSDAQVTELSEVNNTGQLTVTINRPST